MKNNEKGTEISYVHNGESEIKLKVKGNCGEVFYGLYNIFKKLIEEGVELDDITGIASMANEKVNRNE